MRDRDLEPPQKRAKHASDSGGSADAPRPDLKIDFKDNNAKERLITITHSTPSDDASFTFNSSTAKGLSFDCGDLHIQISSRKTSESAYSTQKRELLSTNATTTPRTSAFNPFARYALAPTPSMSSERDAAQRKVSGPPGKAPVLAVKSEDTASPIDKNKDSHAPVTVRIHDKRRQVTKVEAKRSTRAGEVFQVYATKKGLNAERLIFRTLLCLPAVLPQKRLGSILERHYSTISFNVEDLDDTSDYNPFSEYESDA